MTPDAPPEQNRVHAPESTLQLRQERDALAEQVRELRLANTELQQAAAAGAAAQAALEESEEKFRAAFHTSPDAINLNQLDGVYIDINEGFTNLTGYTREDVLGLSSLQLDIWARPADREQLVRGLKASGLVENLESEFRCKDGSRKTALMSARLISLRGTPLILSVTRDITNRKRVAEALLASEARYRTLVEEAVDGILLGHPDGTICGANSRMLALCRRPLKDLLGLPVRELFSPASVQAAPLRFDLLCQGQTVITERELPLPGGATQAIEMHTKQMEDGTYQSIVRDISKRKNAEDSLRESEARFRQVVENAKAVIFVVDTEGVFRLAAGRALARLGLTPGQVVGTPAKALYPQHPAVVEPLSRALAGEPQHFTIHTGALVFDTRLSPLRGVKDSVSGVLGVATDVTGRVRAEEAHIDLERQLLHGQKLESLGVLAGGIAHDFNNLLMAILGNAELALTRLPAGSPAAPQLDIVVRTTLRAADLTRQMLAYAGKGQFSVQPLDLNHLIAENAHLLRAALLKTVTLNQDLAPTLPPLRGDKAQLQQLVMNLITNAAEALEDRPGTVTLRTHEVALDAAALERSRVETKPLPGQFVCLEVSDTGCGMDQNTQERLFDPFFSTKFTGRGLGMAAILGIVAGHDGAIFVDSSPGHGTTIQVLFPAGTAPDLAVPETAAAPHQNGEHRLSGTVLIVDDETPVLATGVALLESLGLRALAAADGAEAVRIYRERCQDIDVVLLDLTMPGMDGVACAQQLRSIRPDAKVVVASGFSPEQITERFDPCQRAGVMQKPYTRERLARTMRHALGAAADQR